MRFGNGYNKRPLAREASHMGRRGAEVNETMTEGRMTGGCLCGSFRFEVTGPLGDVRLCHCDLCRAASGTAFSANARVPLKPLRGSNRQGDGERVPVAARRLESVLFKLRISCLWPDRPGPQPHSDSPGHLAADCGSLDYRTCLGRLESGLGFDYLRRA